jgi:hypothetical protein
MQPVETQFESPHPNGAVKKRSAPPRRRRVIQVVFVIVALAWAYAIWYSVNRTSPEELDTESRRAVTAACENARDDLRALPDLEADASAADDVALVRQENDVFAAMIERIDAVDPVGTDPADALESWGEDWERLMEARAEFASDLAADGSARLQIPAVSAGSAQPVTDRMDEYALQQDLAPCRPEALQAEAVDAPRDYSELEE